MYTTKELFEEGHSLASSYIHSFQYPWEALSGIKSLILSIGEKLSKDEYDKVRRAGDNFTFRAPDRREFASGNAEDSLSLEFCTETLAEIYAEQGYFEQSKSIYRKLLLAFPEKSAYFASLIEKLDKLINNQNL